MSFYDYDGTIIQQNNFDNPQSVMYGKAGLESLVLTLYFYIQVEIRLLIRLSRFVITATYRSNSSVGGGTILLVVQLGIPLLHQKKS